MAATSEIAQVADAASAVKGNLDALTALSNSNSFIVTLFGYHFNLMTIMILVLIVGMLYLFYTIQKDGRLDFADMITKDGRKVSGTKVMQLTAGVCSTWFIVKTGLSGTLSAEIFGIYLTFMAGIEGFSKFMSAKYNYTETSVKDATAAGGADPDGNPPTETSTKTVEEAADGATKTVESTVKKGNP